jgi:TolB-like protein
VRAEESGLLAVATSIADGSDVNWGEVESSAHDERQRSLIRQLRIVSNLAELHRSQMPASGPFAGTVQPSELAQPPGPHASPPVIGRADGKDTAIWGHLRLIEKLGAGAFGEVHRAWDSRLEREVALKILRASDERFESLSERVLREGRLLARVRHPNVLTVFDAEQRDGRIGICMELIKGQTLDQALGKHGPFSAREALFIGLDLCRALAAVHAAGLVHRDVKAQNVMREEGGRIVLMDFSSGQEQREAGATILPSMAGTPLYLAPEILAGKDATVQSDIYSVGVLLYHLVTGSYPIRVKTMEELWKAHKQGQIKRLRDARPDLPDRFVQAVERALAPTPEARYESAGEMEAALTAALDVVPLSATPRPLVSSAPAGTLSEAPPSAVSRRKMAAVWGAGLLAAALVAAIFWSRNSGAVDPPRTPPALGHIERIAVLPFENLSDDENEAYLAGGVPVELTARLGQIGALKVMPWSFMRTFESGASRSIPEIQRATNADVIVDGSVQVVPSTTADKTVRVNVQVFHAGTGMTLWSRSFDRPIGDFLKLQADIAQAIAAELQVKLARREERLLGQSQQADAEAMELYLKGRQAWDERDADSLRRGLEFFRLATERDPNFAPPYVGIADSYALLSAYHAQGTGAEAYARAMEATNRAIALEPMLAEAWTSRAFAHVVFGWEWAAAEADFSRALDLDPSSAYVHHWYSDFLTTLGRHDDAIREGLLAEERAPMSPPMSRRVAWAYYFARRYDAAIAQLKKTLALEPGFVPARTLLARAYVQKGMYDLAIAELTGAGDVYRDFLAQAYAAAGRRAEAEKTIAAYVADAGSPYGIAVAYAVLGERDLAFAWLDRAYENHDQGVSLVRVDPMLEPLRADPRYARFVERLKFPPDR